MRRADAEREADRRNREDPDAARYEFYAYDESAGMAEEAWEVGARLRRGPSTAPATYAGAARQRRRAPRARPAVEAEAPAAAPPPPPSEGVAAVPELYAEPPPETWLEDEAPRAARPADPDRPGVFVRSVAGAVIVMGMLWMAMVVALAVLLKPDDLTGVGLYLGAAVLGLVAIALGAAIRRS